MVQWCKLIHKDDMAVITETPSQQCCAPANSVPGGPMKIDLQRRWYIFKTHAYYRPAWVPMRWKPKLGATKVPYTSASALIRTTLQGHLSACHFHLINHLIMNYLLFFSFMHIAFQHSLKTFSNTQRFFVILAGNVWFVQLKWAKTSKDIWWNNNDVFP